MINLSKLDLNLWDNSISSVGLLYLIELGINELDNLVELKLDLNGNYVGDNYIVSIRDELK